MKQRAQILKDEQSHSNDDKMEYMYESSKEWVSNDTFYDLLIDLVALHMNSESGSVQVRQWKGI